MARSSAVLARLLNADPPRLGPFRLLKALGAGGFAPVYLATETYGTMDLRTVAVKLFAIDADVDHPGSTGTGTFRLTRDRILEEARALCRVEHPNVVRFLQIAEDETHTVYGLAMEHVQGRSLADRLDKERVLPVEAALDIGAAVASALAAVHAVGLVHRDVKPANVIEANGIVKLIDFGIAATARADHAIRVQRSSPILGPDVMGDTMPLADVEGSTEAHGAGTPGYMDPVCLGSMAPATESSDLYGLGATLFECLTGRVPASMGAGPIASRLIPGIMLGTTPPPPLRTVAPNVPEDVARLVDSLVSPRREDRPRHAEWVAVEIARLKRAVRGRTRELPADGPFRGLGPFEREHRDVYFGRSAEIATSLELFRTRGLVALVGPSGSGKSSLARAGVLPALADGALGPWPATFRVVCFAPGSDPRRALAAALGRPALPADPDDLINALVAAIEGDGVGLVLCVDALEELVTVADAAGRAYLARVLARIGHAPVPGLRALVTARRDLLDPLLAVATLGPVILRSTQLVAPLDKDAWGAVLEDALAAYGYRLDDDLRDTLSGELSSTAEAMPLVAFALREAWERRDRTRKVLTRAALADLGGIAGALARHADGVLARLEETEGEGSRAAAKALLVALTTPRGTRARRSSGELAREVARSERDAVLAALVGARLVVEDSGGYTLAHEALLTQWTTLRGWLDALRDDRALAAEIAVAADSHDATPGRDRLWRGLPLATARALVARKTVPIEARSLTFLAASHRAELRARVALGTLVASVVLGALAVFVSYRRAEAQTEAEKQAAAAIVRDLTAPRAAPEIERARAIEALRRSVTACEKDLDRARSVCPELGDGGARRDSALGP